MSRGKKNMKNTELRLISELMKNSRRSDRELARVLRVSQPTASRIRTRLEKEGIVKEYTMIPDLGKLSRTHSHHLRPMVKREDQRIF